MIVGSHGIIFSYITQEDETSNYNGALLYEVAIIQAMRLDVSKFNIGKKTVHRVILNNIQVDLDTYTYINPLLHYQNKQRDVIALYQCYRCDATKQTIINAEKIDLISYVTRMNVVFLLRNSVQRYKNLIKNLKTTDVLSIKEILWMIYGSEFMVQVYSHTLLP